MSASDKVGIGFTLIRLGADVAEGNVVDAVAAARQLFDLGTNLIPVDQQKEFLTDWARRFTDLEVDVLEDTKVDGA